MRDVFGTDSSTGTDATTPSEGGTMSAVSAPPTTAGIAAVVAAAPAAPAGGPPPAPPTLAQAVEKATAKAAADVKVAIDPHATHAVKMAPLAPTVLGSAAIGAAIGTAILPGPGTLVGAGVGWAMERHQIFGGLVGKATAKAKAAFYKVPGTK